MKKIFQSISGNNTLMYKKSPFFFLAFMCGSVFNSNRYNKKKICPICQSVRKYISASSFILLGFMEITKHLIQMKRLKL